MDSSQHPIMSDSSGLRNFVMFAQINGIWSDEFLNQDLRQVVQLCETQDRIPASALIDILELYSVINRRPTLGVEFACWSDLHAIGMLSVLLEACPTIGESLRIQSQYVHLETFAINAAFEQQGDEILFQQIHRVPGQFGRSQYVEGAMMVTARSIRMTAGEHWSPLRVEFEHCAPKDASFHRTQFRCPVEFGAERNGLYFLAEDLHRPLPRGNPRVLAYLERHMDKLDTRNNRGFGNPMSGFVFAGSSVGI